MRKRGLLVAVLGLLFFTVGCSQVTNKPTAVKSGQTTTKSVDYAQLSQS